MVNALRVLRLRNQRVPWETGRSKQRLAAAFFELYPIQLSVHIVDEGVVEHAFAVPVCGATQFAMGVRHNVPVCLRDLAGAAPQ